MTIKSKLSQYTQVEIASYPEQFNYRILFGTPKKITHRSPGENKLSHAYFEPGQIFALDLWHSNEYGTTEWAVYVLQAARPNELIVQVPQVKPGAKVLLEAHGRQQAKAALKELADIQKRVDPTTLPPARFFLTDFRLKAETRNRRRAV